MLSVSGHVELWGVLNVTPDSFSDGGRFVDPDRALHHAESLIGAGAEVIDVGGESSRPAGKSYGAGASLVSPAEELARVLPLVEGLRERFSVTVSVDTVKPSVAKAALSAGARIINDVSTRADPELLHAVASAGGTLVRMHNRGRGEISGANIAYRDLLGEVSEELLTERDRALSAGIPADRIWLDPGIGFAKTAAQSAELIARTDELAALGHPLLVGASRKSFIGALAPNADGTTPAPTERLAGSLVAHLVAAGKGARALRVHDVAEMRQALEMVKGLTTTGDRTAPREAR
ncbi:MAG: dihydropteroate synthase [Myxococcota bacterium]